MPDKNRLLELALKGLEAERGRIDSEIREIKGQLDGRSAGSPDSNATDGTRTRGRRKRRKMSAEAKRKISEAMKRRYAEIRKAVAKK